MTDLSHCKGKFITFEGIEGVGKSTQASKIAEKIREAGIEVVVTREPGGTEIAEAIREVLLKHYAERMIPNTELLLMFAARAQHLSSVIKPALQAGKCVICDRFTDASYAYQGGGRGIYLQHILQLENLVQGELRPDLILLLDIEDVTVALARARNVGTGDRIEIEDKSFFERARKIYVARARGNPKRYQMLDALLPVEDLHQSIVNIISEKFSAG